MLTGENIREVKKKKFQLVTENNSPIFLLSQQSLVFGDMSPRPVNDISILLDHVYNPILNNPANQDGWPDVISKDIDNHIQDLRNVIAEVRKFLL